MRLNLTGLIPGARFTKQKTVHRGEPNMRKITRKTILGIAAMVAVAGCTFPTETDTSGSGSPSISIGESEQPKAEEPQKSEQPKAKPSKVEKPEPKLTVAQENALRSAEDYISMTPFSRTGLINQLKFEGYSKADATVAVNNLDVNWMKQAAKSAEDYLEMSGFSRNGLIEQLMFEGYTRKQAEYGVDQAGL